MDAKNAIYCIVSMNLQRDIQNSIIQMYYLNWGNGTMIESLKSALKILIDAVLLIGALYGLYMVFWFLGLIMGV